MSISNLSHDSGEVTVKKAKSRNLSISEFFKVLQLECIIADLRVKIYQKQKDRDFWSKTYDRKKITVLDIAERNEINGQPLPSIFSDESLLSEYKKEVFGKSGFPNFMYKNLENEIQQGYFDHINYFGKGTDVACLVFDEIKIGKVKYHNPQSKIVTVVISDSDVVLPITDVTRIL